MSSNAVLQVETLLEALGDRLQLEAREFGLKAPICAQRGQHRRSIPVGHLNLIHPSQIQLIGSEELAYLNSLNNRERRSSIAKLVSQAPAALIFTDGELPAEDIVNAAREGDIALLTSPVRGDQVLERCHYFLTSVLAEKVTFHGVFLEVFSIGLLVSGDAGAGKSELALDLISRGHRLIADDAPEFTRLSPEIINGRCPTMLQDCLEVRGLGILNIRAMFGDAAIKRSKYLRLIIHLALQEESGDPQLPTLDRLRGEAGLRDVMGIEVPTISLPVAPGRNIAVLVEAAVRNHMLKMKGIDSAEEFILRQARLMQNMPPAAK